MSREPTAAEIRVAKALCKYDGLRWAGIPTPEQYVDKARIAIRALYEPDDSMLAAYMNALEQPACAKKEPWHNAKMRKRWRAMIDAASPEE